MALLVGDGILVRGKPAVNHECATPNSPFVIAVGIFFFTGLKSSFTKWAEPMALNVSF